MVKPAKTTEQIEIQEIHMREIAFCVLGDSPMIMNRFSQKAWQELLFPSERRSRATLEQTLKHDPVAEFRGAVYRNRDPESPALIHVPNGAFHGALAQVAVDIPGAARAKIERLTKVTSVNVDLFGVPHIFCAMVRNSDMNRTPDVRTRPIFPEWACRVSFSYYSQVLTEKTIANLFGAAGVIVGVGDWRGEKGGSFGSWKLVSEDNADFQRIIKKQGRKVQTAALEQPIFYDADTEELLTWFEKEVTRREKDLPSSGKVPKGKRGVVIENGRGEVLATEAPAEV